MRPGDDLVAKLNVGRRMRGGAVSLAHNQDLSTNDIRCKTSIARDSPPAGASHKSGGSIQETAPCGPTGQPHKWQGPEHAAKAGRWILANAYLDADPPSRCL